MTHEKRVYSAVFSPDGERVATASADGTARLWDARTGQPLSEAFGHAGWVLSAEFSPDGHRLVTASLSGPNRGPVLPVPGAARVWDIPAASAADARLLAALAEAVGGYWLNAAGALTPVDDPAGRLDALRRQVAGAPVGGTSGASLTRWILADRRTRTISPSATVTLDEHIRSELEAMMDSDQGHRGRIHELSIKGDTSSTEYLALLAQQQAVDEANLQRFKEIVMRDGWPKRSVVGDDAATAAFLIVQHADLATQKEYLPLMRAAVAAGEARAADLALLEARVLMREGKK